MLANCLLRTNAFRGLLLIIAALVSCTAQLRYPLLGQEASSPPVVVGASGTTKVTITTAALLERVIGFNTLENTYTAVWWVVLSWKDARAGDLVAANTGAVMRGEATCQRACDDSGLPSAGCCDALWLPHIELPNLISYRDDQMPRYRINANTTSGMVTWSTRLGGEWYTPLDFRAYPFDHQHLLMQLAIADHHAPFAGLTWQHVAKLNNTAHTKGADLSGWRIKWGKGKVYDSRSCFTSYNVTTPLYTAAAGLADNVTAAASPSASASASYQSVRVADRFFASNAGRGTTKPTTCGTYKTVYDEGRVLYGPVVLVGDIMIKRVASYYVMTNLLPVIIISLVVFVVFYMPCNALSDRMVVIMTLFLSLTALQFVFEFPPANYLNALQQVVLVAYVMMLVACIESLIVNRIAILPQQLSNTRTCLRKYSKLFRRIHMMSKVSAAAASAATAAPAGNSPVGGGTPRMLPRVASLPRAGSAVKRSGTPTLAAGIGRLNAWSKAAKLQPLSRFGSQASMVHPNGVHPAPAEATSVAAAAAAILNPPDIATVSVGGSDAGADAPASKEAQDSLRINISPRLPSDSQPSPVAATAVSTSGGTKSPAALFDQHKSQQRLLEDAAAAAGPGARAGACPAIDGRPTPPSLGRVPSRFSEMLHGCGMSLRMWTLTLLRAPGNFYNHCKEDADFAWFIACRIDKWCCVVCFVLYSVCVAVLLWVQTQVGDHKLMLGDRPGNM